MGLRLINLLFVLVQAATVLCEVPQFEKCQIADSQCLKKTAQPGVSKVAKGIPELGIEPVDPMTVETIKVDLSGLKLNVKNAEIKGLRNSVIDKLSINMAKKQLQLNFHADLTLRGKYKASGKLLILPISGDGDVVIKLKNCHIHMDMNFDVVKDQNGKDVIEMKDFKYSYDVKDNAHYHLTNLFNGNKELSETMLTFMNTSWKLLSVEFGKPMFDQPMAKIFNSVKTFLKSNALENFAMV